MSATVSLKYLWIGSNKSKAGQINSIEVKIDNFKPQVFLYIPKSLPSNVAEGLSGRIIKPDLTETSANIFIIEIDKIRTLNLKYCLLRQNQGVEFRNWAITKDFHWEANAKYFLYLECENNGELKGFIEKQV